MTRRLVTALLLPALALSACGSSGKKVDTAVYTCDQFTKSLNTKGDNTSGGFINQLRKQAGLGQPRQTEVQELTLGIIFTCRGKPGTTRPGASAITIAKKIRSGQFHLPKPPPTKKKSTK